MAKQKATVILIHEAGMDDEIIYIDGMSFHDYCGMAAEINNPTMSVLARYECFENVYIDDKYVGVERGDIQIPSTQEKKPCILLTDVDDESKPEPTLVNEESMEIQDIWDLMCGPEEAIDMRHRSKLMIEIITTCETHKLTPKAIIKMTGLSESNVRSLLDQRISEFTVNEFSTIYDKIKLGLETPL